MKVKDLLPFIKGDCLISQNEHDMPTAEIDNFLDKDIEYIEGIMIMNRFGGVWYDEGIIIKLKGIQNERTVF